MKLYLNLKRSTFPERQLNINISFWYILNHNFRCIKFIKKWFNTRIIEIRGIIVSHEDSFQMINFQITCLEITTYAKTIVIIRNGKIVWEHGPFCWYFRFNLKYLGWPYKEYIKTVKNGGFVGNCSVKMTLRLFLPLSVVMTMVSTLLRQFRRSLQIKKIITNALRVL